LPQAINRNALVLQFQPKVMSKTGKLHAVEALVRLNHPRHGIISPNEFIPLTELTETSIMADPERSLAILNRIHQEGVNISVDDFGRGYSSLAYLKKLPVRELKIDKSFVMDMLTNESDATIVNATIQLGHNLE
jgi:EAL domain-containing protein (putative c-di-GMP-specific phosphodiesterase class I)